MLQIWGQIFLKREGMMCPSPWISTWNQLSIEIRTSWIIQLRFAHPTVPIRLTESCAGSTRVRPEWSFGWNHDQTIELTVPELIFPNHLDILRTIVEPDLSWVVKSPKTDMHSHPADHPDSPACVLLLTVLDTASSDEHGQYPNGHLDWSSSDSASLTHLSFSSQCFHFLCIVFSTIPLLVFDHKYYKYVVSFYE